MLFRYIKHSHSFVHSLQAVPPLIPAQYFDVPARKSLFSPVLALVEQRQEHFLPFALISHLPVNKCAKEQRCLQLQQDQA